MISVPFIKGKKILCIYDSLIDCGKLEKEGKSRHNAQWRIIAGNEKKAYAIVSQELNWVSSPKTQNKSNFISGAKVEDWKLWCHHKNHPFPNTITAGTDAGRIQDRLSGEPFALVCAYGLRFQFIK